MTSAEQLQVPGIRAGTSFLELGAADWAAEKTVFRGIHVGRSYLHNHPSACIVKRSKYGSCTSSGSVAVTD